MKEKATAKPLFGDEFQKLYDALVFKNEYEEKRKNKSLYKLIEESDKVSKKKNKNITNIDDLLNDIFI